MPNYLRTKLELELEARHTSRMAGATARDQSLREEITTHNNIITSCLKIVTEAKEDIEDQKSRSGEYPLPPHPCPCLCLCLCLCLSLSPSPCSRSCPPGIFQTTTPNETRKLVAAYLNGTGLLSLSTQRRAILMGAVRMAKQPSAGGGKMQSSVKVEMREGLSSASTPYSIMKKRTQ